MKYIYNLKTREKIFSSIVIKEINDIDKIKDSKYFIVESNNINNINLLTYLSKKLGIIFLYTGKSEINIIKNRVNLIRNFGSDVIIIHSQENESLFNIRCIDSYKDLDVEYGISCKNPNIVIASIIKNITYIDYQFEDNLLKDFIYIYESNLLQKTKIIEKCEIDNFKNSKVLKINKNLKIGDTIKSEDLDLVISNNNNNTIKDIFIDQIINLKIIKNIKKNTLLESKYIYKSKNYIIGDSLLNRGFSESDYPFPWIAYSRNFPHYNNFYDTRQHRNTGYLKYLKLQNYYHNVVIQLGINDCAPRKVIYKKINEISNIGFEFERCLPNKDFLEFIKFESDDINKYIKFSSKNSKYIQEKYYYFYKKHNQCIEKDIFEKNIRTFYNNNFYKFNKIYFISIVKCHRKKYKRNFMSDQIIDCYNNILVSLEKELEKFVYIDLYKNVSDLDLYINKITSYQRDDDWLINKEFNEDGYHLNNQYYYQISKKLDENII
jgi:hypothetical protein